MANYYWVGGTANWDTSTGTNRWATTSAGGTFHTNPPGAGDDVFFDAGSGVVNCTISANAFCRSLNCSNFTGTLTHTNGVTLAIGDGTAGTSNIALKFVSGMTYSPNATGSIIDFVSTSTTLQTIDFGTRQACRLRFTAAGKWAFISAFTTANVATQINIIGGAEVHVDGLSDNSGFDHTWGYLSMAHASANLYLGNATVRIRDTSNVVQISAGTVIPGASTFIIQGGGSSSFWGGGKNYWNIRFTCTGQGTILDNGTTFNDISHASPCTSLRFGEDSTYNVTSFSVRGTSASRFPVLSNGRTFTLNKTSGLVSCDWLTLSNCKTSGGAVWFAGYNSIDEGLNSGWLFRGPQPRVIRRLVVDNAYRFNGSQYNQFTGGGATADPTEYTLAAWVKLDHAGLDLGIVFRSNGNPSASYSHELSFSGALRKFVSKTYDGTLKDCVGTTTVVKDVWYHVVATAKNGSAVRLYVNGVAEGTPMAIGTLWLDGNDWWVGRGNSGAPITGGSIVPTPFQGLMRDLVVWKKELTASEILSLANGSKRPGDIQAADLVIYCPMNNTGNGNNVSGNWTERVGGLTQNPTGTCVGGLFP